MESNASELLPVSRQDLPQEAILDKYQDLKHIVTHKISNMSLNDYLPSWEEEEITRTQIEAGVYAIYERFQEGTMLEIVVAWQDEENVVAQYYK